MQYLFWTLFVAVLKFYIVLAFMAKLLNFPCILCINAIRIRKKYKFSGNSRSFNSITLPRSTIIIYNSWTLFVDWLVYWHFWTLFNSLLLVGVIWFLGSLCSWLLIVLCQNNASIYQARRFYFQYALYSKTTNIEYKIIKPNRIKNKMAFMYFH